MKAVTVHGRTRKQFYTGVADWSAVAEVKAAVGVPVIVNGDITCADSARTALEASGADALMLGRGVYGRPWPADGEPELVVSGEGAEEPGPEQRRGIVIDHVRQSLTFYGDRLGLKMFRKHLGWYIEQAPWPGDATVRRAEKARLCRLEGPAEVERELAALWLRRH